MYYESTYLEHHGIKGQRWGVRRYQNDDGSYTKAGLARYNKAYSEYEQAAKAYNSQPSKANKIKLDERRNKVIGVLSHPTTQIKDETYTKPGLGVLM